MRNQVKDLEKSLKSLKKEFKEKLKKSGREGIKSSEYDKSEKKYKAVINALEGLIMYMSSDAPERRGRYAQEADEFGRITL
tara:strand:- start:1961 stop:2203 length:243 start_codon:yes stop_codon:yes gene_type:complete